MPKTFYLCFCSYANDSNHYLIFDILCYHSLSDNIDAIICYRIHAFALLYRVGMTDWWIIDGSYIFYYCDCGMLFVELIMSQYKCWKLQWTTDHHQTHASAISILTGGDVVIFTQSAVAIAVHYTRTFCSVTCISNVVVPKSGKNINATENIIWEMLINIKQGYIQKKELLPLNKKACNSIKSL